MCLAFHFGSLDVFSLDIIRTKSQADMGSFHHWKETQNTTLNARTTYSREYQECPVRVRLEEVLWLC